MDTLEWNTDLTARQKEPIITVREILQDSDSSVDDQADQADQAAETSCSQSPRKRNHQEVERSPDLTTSIRKRSIEKEQVSPAKRRRSDRGLGSIRLKIASENPNSHLIENKDKEVSDIFESPQTQSQKFESQYEDISNNNFEHIRSKPQELENNYDYISNTFESLCPSVENWIEQQKSQLETVTERINRILGLIQQGERLQQNVLTAEMASQLKNVINDITTAISQNSDVDGSSASNSINLNCQQGRVRSLINQLRVLSETTDDTQCLTELQKYARIRLELDVPYAEEEWHFVMTSFQLGKTDTKLREELERINTRGPKEFPFMLEMNRGEQADVSRQIVGLKRAIAAFYEYEY
ncbi:hypothetical protein DSL72_008705 [Monilinia vaccinii-corymbosi]|uniref:Uncharacterized protein n=1 Tax=Monilinia vaccinii-corymbosi TaxID=61207 RepID=A0A8A3PS68_9HELO|nr:hypothetical protein DSL72_008705 [Monilinia vaccinii-corymbosi]